MADEKKKLTLHQAAEDGTAKIVREKIGDVQTITAAPGAAPEVKTTAADQDELKEKVIATLQTVFDPEIPLNVYDLGLIYRLTIDAANGVKVEMTLTAPGCPVAGDIVAEVKRKIEALPEVPRAEIELVWDPPWSRDRLSEAARLELGM